MLADNLESSDTVLLANSRNLTLSAFFARARLQTRREKYVRPNAPTSYWRPSPRRSEATVGVT
jgi:hypothetical protein